MSFGAKILSFGRGLPKRVVSNKDLEKLFDTSDEWITQRTGIKERRIVDPESGETATSLGAEAVLNAIQNAKKYSQTEIKPEEIDLIICATATGDNLFPTTACLIQSQIGAKNAVAFDISAACTGYIFGLNIAYNFIRSGQFRTVAVVAVDLMSKFVDWGDRRTAIIFGDGAGASILRAVDASEDQLNSFYIKSEGDTNCSLILPNTSSQYPVKAEDINKKPAMVFMDGQAIYQFAVKIVPESIKQACDLAGISPADLDYVVPHQANLRILDSAARRLGIPLKKFICNIERYGNTSAASIPIAFDEALELGLIKPREDGRKLQIAFVGFGAGLTWGSTIVEF